MVNISTPTPCGERKWTRVNINPPRYQRTHSRYGFQRSETYELIPRRYKVGTMVRGAVGGGSSVELEKRANLTSREGSSLSPWSWGWDRRRQKPEGGGRGGGQGKGVGEGLAGEHAFAHSLSVNPEGWMQTPHTLEVSNGTLSPRFPPWGQTSQAPC